MNNESGQSSGPATEQNGFEHATTDVPVKKTASNAQMAVAEIAKEAERVGNNNDVGNEDGKSDSEAETVVMPGKEDGQNNLPKRAIKHEGGSTSKAHRDDTKNKVAIDASKNEGKSIEDNPKKSGVLNETNNSSNLSSTRSSPGQEQEMRLLNRANSESTPAKSKLSNDSDSHSRGSASKKRKISGDEPEDKSNRRRVKRERRSEERTAPDPRKTVPNRSESPARQRPRALSTQSSNPSSTQKRKKPPPLVVNSSKTKTSLDTDSNESGSPRVSAHPKRSAALEDSSISKSHKKLRDKNGRTLLARACALDEVDSVVSRLKDRPEDLDEEDNAGNTPLQIAALEGNEQIVRVLLQHHCKTDCMNSDKDTPLIDAVENSHLEVVKLLLKAGVNPRQVNAKGEEPIDLVDIENENGKDIKAVLERARDRYDRRRQSEDIRLPNTAKESVSGRSPRESPSLHTTRSPPPATSRRRPARSEPSRNDLLWLNPTPERLREKAGMGDDQAVLHILEMKPMNDAEAVLAAAKGGHELCLSFLFAIGKANPDPEPLRGFKDGFNTPMLVAIGRNNKDVLKLVLEQPGFDPTRRIYRKMTYHELAKERRGVDWEEEYKLLKIAHDKHRERHGGKSPTATQKSSPQSREAKKLLRDKTSVSPLRATQKSSSPTLTAKEAPMRKKSIVTDGKNGQARKEREKDGSERAMDNGKKHLKVPKRESREGSTAVSDREASPLAPVTGHKKRSLSDAEKEPPKPRKRLISGKDLKHDQERKRRNSLISMGSTSSNQDHIRSSAKDSNSTKPKREERVESKGDITTLKKRARRSDTPPDRRTSDTLKNAELKKAKRPRVNSDSNVPERKLKSSSSGPARVANMAAPPTPGGSAPVAFMGSSSGFTSKDSKRSPTIGDTAPASVLALKNKSPTEPKPASPEIKITPLDAKMEVKLGPSSNCLSKANEEDLKEVPKIITKPPASSGPDTTTVAMDVDNSDTLEAAQTARKQEEEAQRFEIQRVQREAESLQKKREEEARLRQKREEEEAEQARQEKQAEAEAAILRKKQLEEEETARLKREKEAEEEAERQKLKQAEEEAARLKKRREEQEEVARLKKKREEDQERQRLRRQQEEERRRRDKLPKALCVAADLGPRARESQEISYWLPLWSAKGSQVDPSCAEQSRDEAWVTNIQIAPLLGLADLDLSQCKWARSKCN